jgi:hypothetical protein
MTHIKAQELEAYCATCPSAQEVTSLLQALGFDLAFHMESDASSAYSQVPPLPAQYHYRDRHGNEVIYLAGHDADLDGVRLPEHASRFWMYPGADTATFRRVTRALVRTWSLAWRPIVQARQDVA